MLYNVNLYGGLALFSLFICYDTQNIAHQYREGNDDHVQPALSMFLSMTYLLFLCFHLFYYLLTE